MIKDVKIVSKHSQVMELANDLKFEILKDLIRSEATCQQLAAAFGESKQKIHYHLNKLLEADLIQLVESAPSSGKEVYYRAAAKNYVLDFALGEHMSEGTTNSRDVIQNILENEYGLPLAMIASRLLKDSLKLKPRQKLLIVTGKYNLPLVEKILVEAGRMNVRTTLIYQDAEMLTSKFEEYSLSAFNADYQHFNQLLRRSDVYLNLNGEARNIQLKDKDKIKLRLGHFAKSEQIIQQKKIRVAMMPGLLKDTLSNKSIESELQFWKALDIDYAQLSKDTLEVSSQYMNKEYLELTSQDTKLRFGVQNIFAETGSFTDHPSQSPVINYPGGEILMLPIPFSMDGEIKGDVAYAFGEQILEPHLVIKDNEIKSFSAQSNEKLLGKAIVGGGLDGRKIALICLGTNPNVSLANIDLSFKQKSRGLLSVYWGNNRSLGGNVNGHLEWFLQIEKPKLTSNINTR